MVEKKLWAAVKKDSKVSINTPIAEIMTNFNVTRSQAMGVRTLLKNIELFDLKADPSSQALLKISSLENQLAEQRRLNHSLRNQGVEYQNVIDHIYQTKISEQELQRPIILENDINEGNSIAVACYTDQHIGKIVTFEETNGWNKHNPDIATIRFKRFTSGVVTELHKTNLLLKQKSKKIETLFLAFLGDGIQGRLREEDIEINAMHPTQESNLYQDLLIESIRTIAEKSGIKDIRVILIWGNHGRTSQKLKFSAGWSNSYEYVAYQNIIHAFSKYIIGYNNVQFYVPKSGIQEVLFYDNFPATFSHGHHFNYAGGITGIETPMHRWHYMKQESLPAKRRYIGHWHIYKNGMVSVCGCGIGYDGFALNHNFNAEPPSGFFEVIRINRGYSFNKRIFVDELYR